jgi:hypothetical protein
MMGGRGGSSAVSRERMAADFEALRREQSQLGLEQQIQRAYADLARGNPRGDLGWVSLTALRDRLGGDRQRVDSVLRQMADARLISLLPEENQKTLTSRDRAAQLRYGNEENHMFRLRTP